MQRILDEWPFVSGYVDRARLTDISIKGVDAECFEQRVTSSSSGYRDLFLLTKTGENVGEVLPIRCERTRPLRWWNPFTWLAFRYVPGETVSQALDRVRNPARVFTVLSIEYEKNGPILVTIYRSKSRPLTWVRENLP